MINLDAPGENSTKEGKMKCPKCKGLMYFVGVDKEGKHWYRCCVCGYECTPQGDTR